MGKRILALFAVLTLALGTAPAALAAAEPTLVCEFLRDSETAVLTLEDLDGSDIYGVQLELTLEGEYPDCTFTPGSRTAYAPECSVRDTRDRTRLTIYLTDRMPLNDGNTLDLGELDLGGYGADAFPEAVRITLLGEHLRPLTGGMSGTADVEVYSREEPSGSEDPAPPSSQPDTTPQVPPAPVVYLPFIDVSAGDWFYEAAGYVYARGMMRGLSENTFAPYEVTDRAMIVTILHRLEGSPAALRAVNSTGCPPLCPPPSPMSRRASITPFRWHGPLRWASWRAMRTPPSARNPPSPGNSWRPFSTAMPGIRAWTSPSEGIWAASRTPYPSPSTPRTL